jgi:cob(I)alamin adenosyltransferase
MSIVTKKGDQGKTSLLYGDVVSKDSPRVELNGALDELSSFLGMSKCLIKDRFAKKCLQQIQKDLMVVAAEVATPVRFIKKLKKKISVHEIKRLEKNIEIMEAKRAVKAFCFSLAGENLVSSCLDVSRTICRRAERRVTSLAKKKSLKNNSLLIYLNRLSDLLYLLARRCENELFKGLRAYRRHQRR